MLITEHFSLSEFEQDPTAERRHIDNSPSAIQIINIINLCENLLEPLRVKYGSPITVISGYRSPALNAALHGEAGSLHLTGEAVNIRGIRRADNMRLFHLIREIAYFDQVVAYGYDQHTGDCDYVHISLLREGVNRRRAMVKYKGKKELFNWE